MQQKTNKQIQKVKYLKHTGKIFYGCNMWSSTPVHSLECSRDV